MSGKGYAQLSIDPLDAKKIEAAVKPFGVKLMPLEKLHVTLMYDKSNPEINPGVKPDTHYIATVTGVERMGEPGSKWEAVALQLNCPELKGRHLALRARGFSHSYPDFKIHMSLAYGTENVKLIPLIEKLLADGKIPNKIHLGRETWEELKDD